MIYLQQLSAKILNPQYLCRWFFAIGVFITWSPKGFHVAEIYSMDGIVVASGPMSWSSFLSVTTREAYCIWGLMIIFAFTQLIDRIKIFSLIGFMLTALLLLGIEGLNMKAYDRLLVWQAFVLLFSSNKKEDQWLCRTMMIILYTNLYVSTGLFKLAEPAWRGGTSLIYDLRDINFGSKPLGYLISKSSLACLYLSWFTIIFEILFGFLIWIKKLNPWLLLAGLILHIGIWMTLNVNTFSFVAISMYPIILPSAIYERIISKLNPSKWLDVKRTTKIY